MKKCPSCHGRFDDLRVLCPKCGTALIEDPDATEVKSVNSSIPKTYPMKWYKFLVYFLLPIELIVNIIAAVAPHFDDKIAPVVSIIGLALNGILGISALFLIISFVSYKKYAPKLITIFDSVVVGANLLSVLAESMENGGFTFPEQAFVGIPVSILILVVNIIYFKKRKDLFIH